MRDIELSTIEIAPVPARRRRSRRPFYPSRHVGGPYRIPGAVADELGVRLQGRRNADAAYRLAVHLARNHAASRLAQAFTAAPLDYDGKNGLANDAELGLTAKTIRTALVTLEDVGFLVRAIPGGNGWQSTGEGTRKAPIRYRFGPDFYPLFQAAKSAARRRFNNGHRSRGFALKIDSKPDKIPAPDWTPPAPLNRLPKPKPPGMAGPNLAREAALAALKRLQGVPVPEPSPAALRAGRWRRWR